jgi:D-glucosaminate-6-phosphate ammonia-lyase
VSDRVFEILSRKNQKPKDMTAPIANLAGRWDVDIEFYSSKSQHTLTIEQDGNWLSGTHKGDFTTRDMYGIIDGDQIKISSSDRLLADNITFIFYGTASAESLTGEIFMGEYIRAKFTAKRHEKRANNRPIRVPNGQPLAT